jgi:hypothetical protein
VLAFYGSNLDKQHAIRIFFLNYLLNKIINCTKLLLFDFYLTYNLQVIWTPYSKKRFVVAPVICTGMMDIWTSMVPLICFEIVELYCLARVTQQLGYIHHITIDINLSDAFYIITCRGKNNDYDLLGRHKAYISQ